MHLPSVPHTPTKLAARAHPALQGAYTISPRSRFHGRPPARPQARTNERQLRLQTTIHTKMRPNLQHTFLPLRIITPTTKSQTSKLKNLKSQKNTARMPASKHHQRLEKFLHHAGPPPVLLPGIAPQGTHKGNGHKPFAIGKHTEEMTPPLTSSAHETTHDLMERDRRRETHDSDSRGAQGRKNEGNRGRGRQKSEVSDAKAWTHKSGEATLRRSRERCSASPALQSGSPPKKNSAVAMPGPTPPPSFLFSSSAFI